MRFCRPRITGLGVLGFSERVRNTERFQLRLAEMYERRSQKLGLDHSKVSRYRMKAGDIWWALSDSVRVPVMAETDNPSYQKRGRYGRRAKENYILADRYSDSPSDHVLAVIPDIDNIPSID